MNCIETILTRRSIRKYTNQEVTDTEVDLLIKAGMYAPSAVNKQPWHFIVLRNKALLAQISENHPNAHMLKEASVGITVCLDLSLEHAPGYGYQDCAAATQNILLAAHSLNLGAVWLGVYPRENRLADMKKLLALPEHIMAFSIIAIGHPDESKPDPQRFDKTKIHHNKW